MDINLDGHRINKKLIHSGEYTDFILWIVILKDPKHLCLAACYGPGMDNHGNMDNSGITMVTTSNVQQFSKCTKIFGSLAFHSQSFAR